MDRRLTLSWPLLVDAAEAHALSLAAEMGQPYSDVVLEVRKYCLRCLRRADVCVFESGGEGLVCDGSGWWG